MQGIDHLVSDDDQPLNIKKTLKVNSENTKEISCVTGYVKVLCCPLRCIQKTTVTKALTYCKSMVVVVVLVVVVVIVMVMVVVVVVMVAVVVDEQLSRLNILTWFSILLIPDVNIFT